eukprot:Colp12_sorted_trinity150504_noHs@29960
MNRIILAAAPRILRGVRPTCIRTQNTVLASSTLRPIYSGFVRKYAAPPSSKAQPLASPEPKAALPPMNEEIKAKNIMLIDEKGVRVGEVPFNTALEDAKKKGFDLILVAAKGDMPICKLGNKEALLEKLAAKTQTATAAPKEDKTPLPEKEIRLTSGISAHDLELKTRRIRELLDKGVCT